MGEKLTILGGATGLGSNLADIQSQEFNDLVSYDAKRIANSMTRCTVKKCAKSLGFKEVLCRFDFVEQDSTTPKEYLELAKQASELGIQIDVNKLKELTKLQFIDTESWSPAVSNGWTKKDAEEVKEEREKE